MAIESETCEVVIIDPVGKKAGLDHYNDSLAGALKKQNVAVRVFSNYKSDYSEPVFKFRFGKSIFFVPEMIFSMVKVFRLLKEGKPNAVILHLFTATKAGTKLALQLKKANVKLIYIVHDLESLIDSSDFSKEMNDCLELADEIVVHNQFSYDELNDKFPSVARKVTIIAHGNYLDLPSKVSKEDARTKLGIDDHSSKVLFFGMIKPSKGLNVLLEAMMSVNAQLIVAGRMRNQSSKDFEIQFLELKKENKLLTDIGYINNEKRDLYFKAADIIVLPYHKIYQSGVLIMAMSYGVPVIASDLKPNLEFASNIDCIEFFKDGNHAMLAQEINALLANSGRRKLLQKNAIDVLEESHNWVKIANNFKLILNR